MKIALRLTLLAALTFSAPLLAQTFVYVSEASDGNIARYRLNEKTGALTLLGQTSAGGKVMPMALSADHHRLYAAIRSQPLRLMSWTIDAHNGDLLQASETPAAASYPYISTQFQRQPNGALKKIAEWPNAVATQYHLQHGRERLADYSDPTPRIWSADIRITPNGRFLYVTERTSSTVTGYRVNQEDGKLTLIGSWPVEKQPRGIAISPDGRWLIASGEKSAVTDSYAINQRSGVLKRVGSAPAGGDANWVTVVSF